MNSEYPSKYNSVLAFEKALMKRIFDLEQQLQGAQHQIWVLKQEKAQAARAEHLDWSGDYAV